MANPKRFSSPENVGVCMSSMLKVIYVMKGWQYRYFVLDDNAGLFSYYTSREKMKKGARRGCVRQG